ncbi:MAG: RNA 2 - tpt1 family protein [Satyrvirus sp.]|uniref:RNA 2-tpt1 family protein n=1 Tax=Satyrvirus sp. TaxID=2487771 RepID=A0A3G5ADX3_9VIRU|nr:MAG: RNA 2 - tpt1 family protein [Satyrvirus sp.]
MNANDSTRISKYLSYILRHGAVKEGYNMDPHGFICTDEIISKCIKHTITFKKIKNIVDTNDKKRFELVEKNNKWYIRAVQGHSISEINLDLGLHLVKDPSEIPIVVHGTTIEAYKLIKQTGINRMSRNHIHFAHGTPDDKSVISGMRKTSEVMVYIDVPKAMDAGIKFYKSSNGVILSEGINGIISPTFFLKVKTIK